MKSEKNIFILLLGLLLAFYFMPIGSTLFTEAVLSGLKMLHSYTQEHVLTCLIPAFFIAGAIGVFIRKDLVLKYLSSKTKKVISYSLASISGGVLAVCSCTILPMFAGIRKRGAGLGPAITFLFSGPAINIAALFLTFSVLGPAIGLARVFLAIPLAVAVGLSMQAIFREQTEVGELFLNENSVEDDRDRGATIFILLALVGILLVNGLQMIEPVSKYILMGTLALAVVIVALSKLRTATNRQWLTETWTFTKLLLPWLFIGVFIAGFIDPLLPEALVIRTVGSNTLLGNLIASVVGALMYFSTLTEIPILETFINKGMHPGPAIALLLAGPSLSLPNMLVIRSVLGNKRTLAYVLLVVAYSTLGGFQAGSVI